jgi:DNA-directed RNA polymerase beta subunit
MASTTICVNNKMNTCESEKMLSDAHFDISKEPYIETPWNIIETYFQDQHLERLVRHQLESYNNFVGYQIIKTIEMFNPVHIKSENDYDPASGRYSLEIYITFENFHIYRPQIHENNGAIKLMFPQEARLRNFTYASAMTIDINIKYIVRTGQNLENASTFYKTLPKIHIGKLPIMLKSNICVLNQYKYVDHQHTGECRFDAGGHFIINGSEKTVLGQERAAENRVYCFNISKNNTKYTWSAEIKSVPDFKCISPKQINLYMNSKNNGFGYSILVQIPRVKQPIPLFIVFRALGVISDKEICEYILLDLKNEKYKAMLENIQASIIESNKYLTQEDCIRHIMSYVIYTPINMDRETGAKKKYEFTLDVLHNDLFPHCQTSKQKIYFLGYMANKLLQAQFEWIKADDRDSYLNKRVDLTGTSLNNLFRNYFNKLVKDMEKQIIKEINTGSWRSTEDYTNIINNTNIYKIVKSTTIENGIKRALSTGDFGIKHTNSNKVGVAQVLNRLTYVASLSHLRRISTPTDKSGKLVPPRKLHSTSWGFLCPAETPEGASVGIVKNLSYMTHVTIHSNSMSIYEYVTPHIKSIDALKPIETFDKVKVFINGSWMGVTDEPEYLYNLLKEMKCKGIINVYTSVIFDYKLQEIRVCNDSGRITRPLLRVKNNNLLLTNDILSDLKQNKLSWDDLLTNCKIPEAIIEYIDPEEQSFSMIATKPKQMVNSNDDKQMYKYTHCEIHPSTIFGVVASCIPYPDHNQSPRNTYQCLDINETVLLTNGRKIPIKDVKIGDDVVCFNPETMDISYTKVVNQYVRQTDKTIYKVKTITNKEIIATEDHKFMTMEGWKQVDDFIENDTYIGIMPNPEHIPLEKEEGLVATLILDETMFRNKFIELGLELSYINKQILKLSKGGLLPLYTNHPHLPILARIFGFILADGSINIYQKCTNTKYVACSFDFGTEHDVKMFEQDVEQCGIDRCKYNKSTRTFNNVTHTTYAVTHNGSLPSLLIALDVTFGRKTETMRNPVPDWILLGEKIIKREFIAGFQGGDGCKVRWNKMNKRGYNFICAETSQQINPKYVDSLNNFMRQCVELISEFNVDVHLNNSAMIDDNRYKVSYKILDKQTNLINYVDKIGYRYSCTKYTNSFVITEYLKYKNICFENHLKFIEKVRAMCDEEKSNTCIANELNINVSTVSDIRRSYNENRKISMHNLKNNTIENWLKDIKIINNMVFMQVVSVEKVENRLVSDITVESDDHSFIAGNNFLSSNCAQAKQAMGVYATNFNERMDKTAYVLNSPTRPLVDTRVMNLIKLNQIPSGCNINVAIMTHTGYNQEDSVLINKGAIDRGLFQITIYHTEKDEDKQKINGDEEIRCKPDSTKTKGMKFGNYNKVNSKGVIPENSLVENRDIIIAKVSPIKENRNDHMKVIKYEDQSKIYRTVEETYIDKNYIDRNGDGYSFAKVRLRALRKPVIGDKFSSRHGQKGTVGNIIPEEDMPFTRDGNRPDIIINPHAIPSRMTIGQLKETLLGKVLVRLGLFGDGTSFGELDVSSISSKLLSLGYEAHGNELLYNGLTGEQIECSVFMGPVFYQRLKHMVNDKQHSRSIGPMVNLTRQPAEGRSRDGGLRFGEMERDCMVSHGAARFTRGRMYDASDKYSVHVCRKCGLIASYNDELHIHQCRTCDNRTDFSYLEIPYACKLLFQELTTMNVVPRVITNH